MHDSRAGHPTQAELQAFDSGQLPPTERESIERHLETCSACCNALDTVPEGALEAMLRAFVGSAECSSVTPATDGSEPAPDIPAELVGHPRYRVLSVLGAGGMGVVYKAVHRLMERVVALKVLNRTLTARPGFAERFRREVKAAARLAHPNIVTAYDADEADGTHFLVMEYIDGTTLDAEVMRRGPLPVHESCSLIRQAALGLQHAHERGMVHCDIKPGNILLEAVVRGPSSVVKDKAPADSLPLTTHGSRTTDIRVKILDFGLARVLDEGSGTSPPSGTVVGTPDYVAPEQARDPKQADTRSDIYSLGCTLYYLLAGQPPFPSGTVLQKLLAHQQCTPPPLRAVRGDVPTALVRVLERMLAKDPGKRYATPAEVAADLAPLIDPTASQPTTPRRRPWRTIAIASAAVAVAGGLLVATCVAAAFLWQANRPSDTHPLVPVAPAPAANPTAFATMDDVVRQKREVRDQAAAWLRLHKTPATRAGIVTFVSSSIDKDFEGAEAFQVLLAPSLVQSGKPTLLVGRAGTLHVLEVAAAMAPELPPGAVRVLNYSTGEDRRRAVPRVVLSDATVEGAEHLFAERARSATVAYRIVHRWPEAYALRATFYFSKRGRRHVEVRNERLPETDHGTLRFALQPLEDADQVTPGPDAVFVEVVTHEDGQPIVESNAAAVAVRVMPPDAARPN